MAARPVGLPTFAKFLCVVLASLPGCAIVVLASVHLKDALAVDGAIPAPRYVLLRMPRPQDEYLRAEKSLDGADSADGDAIIMTGEMATLSGAAPSSQTSRLARGLANAPLSARGWLLLARSYEWKDRDRAASALSQSLVLAPYDYWIAGQRALLAAVLWDGLDRDTRAMALRQVVLLWEEPRLRFNLHTLLASPKGVLLVANAFTANPGELRALNRWVSAERRRQPSG